MKMNNKEANSSNLRFLRIPKISQEKVSPLLNESLTCFPAYVNLA